MPIQGFVRVSKVKLADLTSRWGALGFLFSTPIKPVFGNDQVAVTRKAADQLAECFNKLVDDNRPSGSVDRPTAQRFVLQMLVALFAEDIGMLPRYLLANLLEDCKTRQDSRDLIGGLFEAMNRREKTPDDRYQGVDYFNGGLFAEPARVELRADELALLKAAAREDWSKVRPEVFGTLFEHSLGKEERHAYGAHFTHPTDIMKIVGPTIVEPWRNLIEGADTLKRLRDLWQRMHDYTVLDPACGSGNFLYLAYRELKRLEARLFERMAEISGSYDPSQLVFGFVSARQFYGMDINPFAVELAKVTMMIARKLAIDELHITERALPLDNLDENFKAGDALIDELGNPAGWPKVDVIIGNPPFLGAKRLKPERGLEYVDSVRRAYPDVPAMADYCVYWFRKANDHLAECTLQDPVAGRAGLVGTQNIRNNQSRVGGLDAIVQSGSIIEAVDDQPWSGEAVVHVSIANWVKTRDASLVPAKKKLWLKVDSPGASRRSRAVVDRGLGKGYELELSECDHINSSLSNKTDVSQAQPIRANADSGVVCQGITTAHDGFIISPEQAAAMIKEDPKSKDVIAPFLGGRELVTGDGRPSRFLIDFEGLSILEVQGYKPVFRYAEIFILPDLKRKAKKEAEAESAHKNQLDRWWLHWRPRQELRAAISRMPRYLNLNQA